MNFKICIPTLNAASEWRKFSDALMAQDTKPSEVIVIDSSSDDDTAQLAVRDGYRVVAIPRTEFRHGGTRQVGAELAGVCDVVVYLTQDALLSTPESLRRLILAFEEPKIGAAYGRQLPRPGATPIEAHARLFNYRDSSYRRSMKDVSATGFKTCFFSNSWGAYRLSALSQIGGFDKEIEFGEDTVAVARMLQAGWEVGYVADATVYHSHDYTGLEQYRRYIEVGRLHVQKSGVLSSFGGASGEGFSFVKSELSYLIRENPLLIPAALYQTGMKYAGYRIGRSKARQRNT